MHRMHGRGYALQVQLITQTEEAKARIAAARSSAELRGALTFLADVARDGSDLCARMRDELEQLGRPPPLATRIDQADAIAGLLVDGLSALSRDAVDQAQDATTTGELRVGARNLVWFANRVAWLVDELSRLRSVARDYHDRAFASMWGDADRNAAEAAIDAAGEGSAVSFDLDRLAQGD
jgi:hypothetical protein